MKTRRDRNGIAMGLITMCIGSRLIWLSLRLTDASVDAWCFSIGGIVLLFLGIYWLFDVPAANT